MGLTDVSDLQLAFTPYSRLGSDDGTARHYVSGFGDLFVRYKRRLTAESGGLQVGVIPFVKLPTAAAGLGNGEVEGGIAVPVSFVAAGPVTMTLGPEFDLLANADGNGKHLAAVNVFNLSAPVARRLTLSAEFWYSLNFDPDHAVRQASLDAALAYLPSNDFQFDAGVNFGLSRATPDIELYAGLSTRF